MLSRLVDVVVQVAVAVNGVAEGQLIVKLYSRYLP